MSADNGIYILKTKDQYRVAHLQGIGNVTWSAIDGDWYSNESTRGKFVPTRVVEMWGDCKFTRDEGKALKLAHKWASSLPICEYGVNIITYNKTWKHILEDAQKYAKKEIKFIKENGKEKWWNLNKLQKIADGYYLSEWLHRNKKIMKNEDWIIIDDYFREKLPKNDCELWITRTCFTGERWVQKVDFYADTHDIEWDGTIAFMIAEEKDIEPSPYTEKYKTVIGNI